MYDVYKAQYQSDACWHDIGWEVCTKEEAEAILMAFNTTPWTVPKETRIVHCQRTNWEEVKA